ncbi:MAG TPA: hypothetical protein VKE94_00405, partial [Gemmataceae bacterium]|nr:hypothetical protein [Gemmataceae bacterium]
RKVDAAKTLAKYEDLPDIRAELKTKLDALLTHYRENGSSPEHRAWLKDRYSQVQLLGNSKFYKVVTVPLKSPGIVKLKEEFELLRKAAFSIGNPVNPTKDNVKAWELLIAKADEISAAREQTDKAETQLFKKYRPIQKRVEEADKVVKGTAPPLPETDTAFADELAKFRDFWDKDKRYGEAEKLIDSLKTKAEAVLQPVIAAGKQKAKDIGDMPESSDGEKSNKRTAAQDAINTGQLSQFQLESLTPDEQIKLMKSVRVGGDMNFGPLRAAQIKIYGAMKLDQKFLAEDAKGRKKMIEKLLEEKKDLLLEAKSNWNKKPANDEEKANLLDQKRQFLEEIVKAQCKAFGYDFPILPILFKDEPKVLDNGSYSWATNKITLNMNSVALNDFESALDLVIHENFHNYQRQLVARLHLPDSDEKKIKPTDPLYDQARCFELNHGGTTPGAYVKSGEGQAAYMKQPKEEHSWYAGPKTARGLVKEINKLA